jgi:hypothetical protein
MDNAKVVLPQIELQKIAEANKDLVAVATQLYSLTETFQDPEVRANLNRSIRKILDSSHTISSAVQTSGAVKRW